MTNREYTALVDKGQFPEDPYVPLDEPFVNTNGAIQNLLLERFTSAAVIRSRAGAIRANHYHKTDWHYAYVVSGAIRYYWRPVGSKEQPKSKVFTAGQMFFSPPLVEHAMAFLDDTVFLTFAKNIRDTAHHEEDVVRVPLITVEWKGVKGFHDPDAIFQFKVDPAALEKK